MQGVCLRFYTYENEKHKGMLLYEWLLELARKNKIPGGSAFRGIAGYGRHGILHEESFYELASNVPLEVTFILEKEKAESFLTILRKENLNLFYTTSHVDYDFLTA